MTASELLSRVQIIHHIGNVEVIVRHPMTSRFYVIDLAEQASDDGQPAIHMVGDDGVFGLLLSDEARAKVSALRRQRNNLVASINCGDKGWLSV